MPNVSKRICLISIVVRREKKLPLGHLLSCEVSLLNPLHSCIDILEEPVINALARKADADPAAVVVHWCAEVGVCPIVKASPRHLGKVIGPSLFVPGRLTIEDKRRVSALAELCATRLAPAPHRAILDLHSSSAPKLRPAAKAAEPRWKPESRVDRRVATAPAEPPPLPPADAPEWAAAGQTLKTLLGAGDWAALIKQYAMLERDRPGSFGPTFVETVRQNALHAERSRQATKAQVLNRLLAHVEQRERERLREVERAAQLAEVPAPVEKVGAPLRSAIRWSADTDAAPEAASRLEQDGYVVLEEFLTLREVREPHSRSLLNKRPKSKQEFSTCGRHADQSRKSVEELFTLSR